jgi:hypothetical protein
MLQAQRTAPAFHGPLRGANIGFDVVQRTIFAARRADVSSSPRPPLSAPEMMSVKPICAPRSGLRGEVSVWPKQGLALDLV